MEFLRHPGQSLQSAQTYSLLHSLAESTRTSEFLAGISGPPAETADTPMTFGLGIH
jgi:hypothetical protein